MVVALVELAVGRLASAGADGRVCIWSMAAGTEEQEPVKLKGHDGLVWALSELADGRLASAGRDGRVCIWRTAAGTEEQEPEKLKGHDGAVRALCELRTAAWCRLRTIVLSPAHCTSAFMGLTSPSVAIPSLASRA